MEHAMGFKKSGEIENNQCYDNLFNTVHRIIIVLWNVSLLLLLVLILSWKFDRWYSGKKVKVLTAR